MPRWGWGAPDPKGLPPEGPDDDVSRPLWIMVGLIGGGSLIFAVAYVWTHLP